MSKNVLTAIVLSDEAETFALIEPFTVPVALSDIKNPTLKINYVIYNACNYLGKYRVL